MAKIITGSIFVFIAALVVASIIKSIYIVTAYY